MSRAGWVLLVLAFVAAVLSLVVSVLQCSRFDSVDMGQVRLEAKYRAVKQLSERSFD